MKRKRIFHFTKSENIPKILKQGFDTSLPPIHGTGYGRCDTYTPEQKQGEDVLYFTRDKKRWNKATVYIGEGKGNEDYSYYDFDKHRQVIEKKSTVTIHLEPVEAVIKAGAKILAFDNLDAFVDFLLNTVKTDYTERSIIDVIEKAKELGFDVLEMKYVRGQWGDEIANEYGLSDLYDEVTGRASPLIKTAPFMLV
jgi:hypothetical protein